MPYKDPAMRRAHRRANRERFLAIEAAARLKRLEARRIRQMAYYYEHRDAIIDKNNAKRRDNPDVTRIKDHQHYKKHFAYYKNLSQQRRAKKKHVLINDLTAAQWREIQASQNHRCHYCGKRCKGRLTQDHITPLHYGGSHTLHNVIGACRSCNSRKQAGPPPAPVQPLLLTIAPSKKEQIS